MLVGFVKEMQNYVPRIHTGLAHFLDDPQQRMALEEAYQAIHTIKGAAMMMGLPVLGHLAYYVEDTIVAVANTQGAIAATWQAWLRQAAEPIARYVTGLINNDLCEHQLVTEMVRSCRRLRGLPAADDPAIVAAILSGTAEVPEVATPQGMRAFACALDDVGDSENMAAWAAQDALPTTPAAGEAGGEEVSAAQRYILFTLACRQYAVGLSSVLEVSRIPPITPVPQVPPWLHGVINLRGDIVSVIDFRTFLGLEAVHQSDNRRLLVVTTADATVTTSLIVDQINGIVALPMSPGPASAPPPEAAMAPYAGGIYRHEDQVVTILDLERFLHAPVVRQFE
jgi:purine-binding chemotaxis protein CheW